MNDVAAFSQVDNMLQKAEFQTAMCGVTWQVASLLPLASKLDLFEGNERWSQCRVLLHYLSDGIEHGRQKGDVRRDSGKLLYYLFLK